MEMFEKVEKLRERACVTFEEAKAALDACDGDLLDAMVYLEKQGKAKKPEQSTYSTSYEEQEKFVSVEDKVNSQEKTENLFSTFRKIVRGFVDKCRGNYFCMKKDDDIKVKIPVLGFIVLVLAFWQVVIPAMIILLFFGCSYSFYGKDDLKQANDIMNKARDLAEQVKENLTKDSKEDPVDVDATVVSETTVDETDVEENN